MLRVLGPLDGFRWTDAWSADRVPVDVIPAFKTRIRVLDQHWNCFKSPRDRSPNLLVISPVIRPIGGHYAMLNSYLSVDDTSEEVEVCRSQSASWSTRGKRNSCTSHPTTVEAATKMARMLRDVGSGNL